jgi:hypothetical protein
VSSRREPSSASKSRNTWRRIGSQSELGAGTDKQAVANPRGIGGVRVDPRRLNTAGESQRSSERGALVSYFRDIADIPTLKKEDEVLLAKEIEAATLAFRDGMMSVAAARPRARIWVPASIRSSARSKRCGASAGRRSWPASPRSLRSSSGGWPA